MKLSPGNRVYWWHDGDRTPAVIERIYQNKVKVKTADFATVTVGIDEVELAPIGGRGQEAGGRGQEDGAYKMARQPRHTAPPEGRRVEGESLPPNSLPPNNLPPNNLPPNSLPPNSLPPNSLPPNSWIETKKIRGQIYKYARWREEIEINGIKKMVKRSRYLEKVATD